MRALDNVLDVTFWRWPQQDDERQGPTPHWRGLYRHGQHAGHAAVPALRPARGAAPWPRIAECMRDAAYAASVDLARAEAGVSPFDARLSGRRHFRQPLAAVAAAAIRAHGIRNSHLLSIAPRAR